ncbi:MAG TPA: DinB family protein [Pirellulales bacterium]|nr:DinB family protein [Pirellulales bacterium]
MNAQQAIRGLIEMAHFVATNYLQDLTDADLLVRPVPGANHIAWQLGHLIVSSQKMFDTAFPGTMQPLPAGFAEKHTPETAAIDDPAAFFKKDEYLKLMTQQREAALKKLESVSESDLDQPAPEAFRSYLNNIGDLFSIQGSHLLMHAGQWAVVRRKLGRKPLF